jgi:hypothetical protein
MKKAHDAQLKADHESIQESIERYKSAAKKLQNEKRTPSLFFMNSEKSSTSSSRQQLYAQLKAQLAQTGWISEGYVQARGPGAGGPRVLEFQNML